MPNEYSPYPMVVNSIFIGVLGLRDDQIDYFNIPVPTAAEQAFMSYVGSINPYTRNIFTNRLTSTTPTRTIQVGSTTGIPRVRKKIVNSRGGKIIKIPTELTSTPSAPPNPPANAPTIVPSIRFTTIKFPGGASNGEISAWIFAKFQVHKPSYFKTPSGANYPVVALPPAAIVTP